MTVDVADEFFGDVDLFAVDHLFGVAVDFGAAAGGPVPFPPGDAFE